MNPREVMIEKLIKLRQRSDWGSTTMPSGNCTDVTTHLAGLFLKIHSGAILEALRRAD